MNRDIAENIVFRQNGLEDGNLNKEFAACIIHLLRGPVYAGEKIWDQICRNKIPVNNYLSHISLILELHEEDGYAFIRQKTAAEEDEPLPNLVRKIPLTFEVSLLCVILREEYEHFNSAAGESVKLYISVRDIRERVRIYFKEKTDETRLHRELKRYINKVEELGFLKLRAGDQTGSDDDIQYEVLPIIKAKIDPQFLEEYKKKIQDYANTI